MKHTAAILAALAALTILSAPAEARSPKTTAVAPKVDVAAIPAYPTDHQATGRAVRGRAGGYRAVAVRGRRHGSQVAQAAPRSSVGQIGPGIVRSGKTGATAHVAARYAAIFQSYVDDLEAHGATVKFLGGYRPGPCASWSEHPCGKALDVCQTRRGVVDPRCHLPGRAQMIAIANRHDLQEGGEWCHSDMGHAQIDRTASRCGHNLYAAVGEYQAARSRVRHHRVRLARR